MGTSSDLFAKVLKGLTDYGALGLVLSIFLYILIRGEFVFRYPRRIREDSKAAARPRGD